MCMSYLSYTIGPGATAKSIDLTRLTLGEDDKGYYLSATYKVETDHCIRELDFPRIRLEIDTTNVAIESGYSPYSCRNIANINLGFAWLPLGTADCDGNGPLYTNRILEEKYTEMTLDEIENKLGYKVKIVNK